MTKCPKCQHIYEQRADYETRRMVDQTNHIMAKKDEYPVRVIKYVYKKPEEETAL